MPYQKIYRFYDIKEHFILAVLDSFWSPGHCISNSRWWSGCSFQFVPFLGDVPRDKEEMLNNS